MINLILLGLTDEEEKVLKKICEEILDPESENSENLEKIYLKMLEINRSDPKLLFLGCIVSAIPDKKGINKLMIQRVL